MILFFSKVDNIKAFCNRFTANIIKNWLHSQMVWPFKNVKSQRCCSLIHTDRKCRHNDNSKINLLSQTDRSLPPCHRPPVMFKYRGGLRSHVDHMLLRINYLHINCFGESTSYTGDLLNKEVFILPWKNKPNFTRLRYGKACWQQFVIDWSGQ